MSKRAFRRGKRKLKSPQSAKEAIGDKKLRVIADRGYFKGPEILAFFTQARP